MQLHHSPEQGCDDGKTRARGNSACPAAGRGGARAPGARAAQPLGRGAGGGGGRSEEHTSELQSRPHLVCSLLLEKKNKKNTTKDHCLLRILSILNPFNTNTNAN